MFDEAGAPAWRWARLAAALVLLNTSLTFVSVWPTLAVRPAARLSFEAALLVLGIAIAWTVRRATLTPRTIRMLATLWVVLIISHYLDVSTRALYGRGVSLYWDLQLLPDVGKMFAYVARPRVLLPVVAGLAVVPVALYLPMRWAIRQVTQASANTHGRRLLIAGASAVLVAGVVATVAAPEVRPHAWATPVAAAIGDEIVEFVGDATGRNQKPLPAAPSVHNDLSRVSGADVAILFVESYGMTSWERPEFQPILAPARDTLAAAIAGTGRSIVTGVVESTTFGGESWLAHISLLSGTEVRDPEVNRRLMADHRETLIAPFRRAGYRTFGVFPGLKAPWPEGAFYGFDRIVGAPDLGYKGPPFGWWDVTDQFVLARMDEIARPTPGGGPVLVFLPTISTHTPFTPVPPYQPDWSRLLTATPYDEDDLMRAYEATPDWSNLGPDYARALAYVHKTLAGYLQRHERDDMVLVVLGDHQPPALVSGEGASWNVPIHVIASRPAVLESLRLHGFRDGLVPHGPALARMDTLMPILLDAFGNTDPMDSGSSRSTSKGE
jgi:hypothetical protein